MQLVQLYALAALRRCATYADWPVVLEALMEVLVAQQQVATALAVISAARTAYAADRDDTQANEREWLLEILYTLEISALLARGDDVTSLLDSRPLRLNPLRVGHIARQCGKPAIAMRLYRQANDSVAVAAVLVEDMRDLDAAFEWAAKVDKAEMWRYVGMAKVNAERDAPAAQATGPDARR